MPSLARLGVVVFAALLSLTASAAVRSEYRAYWVDTFNSSLSTHADVVAVVNNAKASNANAIFAQVRRRGDSWYLTSLEPKPDFLPTAFPVGFDPLADLINEAHAKGIEVHAFVIIGAVWNKNPTFAPSATLGPPTNPNHVFNLHGGYDPVSRTVIPGPNNWLTRSLIPDGTAAIGFQGHRVGNDFWIDLGHPDASAYTVDVLMHLVRNYDIDGLHLDRIRYPEMSIGGQTPTTGTSTGYNAVNVARFQNRHGRTEVPGSGDPQWMQWRRDQVTNFVRRLYLNVNAERPDVRISAALIVFGNGPVAETDWPTKAEAHWRVYQDWRTWTEEGIIDIAIPMNYKNEHVASNRTMFDEWSTWLKNHQYNRAGMIGMAGTSPTNSLEGLLRQTRRALAPSLTGQSAAGVIYFSMANSNAAITANAFSVPPGQNTPVRTFPQFASGLTTGKYQTTATPPQTILVETQGPGYEAIFKDPALIPDFPWKSAPTKGHLMGFAKRGSTPLDTADVTIENVDTQATRSRATDGGGFYGGVDLEPGLYRVKATQGSSLCSDLVSVVAGNVTTVELPLDTTAPVITCPNPPAFETLPGECHAAVNFSVSATDSCNLVDVVTTLVPSGAVVTSGSMFPVGTSTILATATDRAGNAASCTLSVTVVDAEMPVISDLSTNRTSIFPPNHQMVTVRVNYDATDNCGVTTKLTVTSNEPEDGLGDGDTSPDWEIVDQHEVRLRAERSGNGPDRVYTITVTATDPSLNTTEESVQVTVPHDNRS